MDSLYPLMLRTSPDRLPANDDIAIACEAARRLATEYDSTAIIATGTYNWALGETFEAFATAQDFLVPGRQLVNPPR